MSQATVTIYNAGPSAVKLQPQGGVDSPQVIAPKASLSKTVSDQLKPLVVEVVKDA